MVVHGRKTIEQMLADDIERCEEYLSSPDDEVLGQKLYVDITSRYDSIIPGFGNGLYQYFAEQHFYDPEISCESLIHNLHVLQGKMLSYQAKTYPPAVNENTNTQTGNQNSINNTKVFIVHGHDNEAKQELARVLEKSGFEAIILHEQPNAGKTIIEKIERYTDVG
ncbi:MAG: nucleotide-binding protein, partial [Bacteroidia bacterium]|nr:nucleotide-binding protein [Bacteroidia bacterium]